MPLQVLQDPPASKVKRMIAVAAGKGGVGKSTVTVLLALGLKKRGLKVAILDADLYGPSIRYLLPEDRLPSFSNGWLQPAVSQGIKILSVAYFQQKGAMRAPIANGLLEQFFKKTAWGDIDILLIDFPPGTGDIPLTVMQRLVLDGALMVTTPQKLAILDVRHAMGLFRDTEVPILGIVENMSYYSTEECTPFGKEGANLLAAESGIPVVARIPLDPAISDAADRGRLAFLESPFASLLSDALLKQINARSDSLEDIRLIDSNTLRIIKVEKDLKAFVLQKHCPCAHCNGSAEPKEDVSMRNIERVGRYGFRIDFSSGCSSGIYSFELLMRIPS